VLPGDAFPLAGTVRREVSSAWGWYDVGVKDAAGFVGLLELSIDDSTVCHALHNGEQKLLGLCDAIGCVSEQSFSQTRGFTPQEVSSAQAMLGQVGVRGIFFIGRVPQHALDVPQRAVWTDGGSRPFWSALVQKEHTTLREALGRLSEAGLYCWYYSLIDGERLRLAAYSGI
jgi:hypothetical protein